MPGVVCATKACRGPSPGVFPLTSEPLTSTSTKPTMSTPSLILSLKIRGTEKVVGVVSVFVRLRFGVMIDHQQNQRELQDLRVSFFFRE